MTFKIGRVKHGKAKTEIEHVMNIEAYAFFVGEDTEFYDVRKRWFRRPELTVIAIIPGNDWVINGAHTTTD